LAEKVTDKQYVGLAFKNLFPRSSVGLSTLEFGTRRLEEGTRRSTLIYSLIDILKLTLSWPTKVDHGLINNIDTKEKCRYSKTKPFLADQSGPWTN
jgi:hypothetical protein